VDIPVRITLRDPPPGVRVAMQRGKAAAHTLVAPSSVTRDAIVFDLSIQLKEAKMATAPDFTGPFVQGKPGERFIYVNWGQSAGDATSQWTRRAKVWLRDITPANVDELRRKPGAILTAVVNGTGRDGTPVCASTNVVDRMWRVIL